MRWMTRGVVGSVWVALALTRGHGQVPDAVGRPSGQAFGFEFLETGFENASPLWYEVAADRSISVYLNYDHERASPNRAAGHIHLRLHAEPGSRQTLEFKNLDNVWNGQPGSVARELKALVVSEDGKQWRSMATEALPENRVRLTVEMPGPSLYVARVEPYRLSDLEAFLERIRRNRRVRIETIGETVGGRPLEMIRVGRSDAPFQVFVRARAHPWESGGNWVVEGLVERLLEGDATAKAFLRYACVHILPMANKDGVVLGRTRFNLRGKDLNRNWDQPADPILAPENAALERWLEGRIRAGRKPNLALELHNDGNGMLHISRPPVPRLAEYLARMETLEALLRRHTWFTEGSTKAAFRNSGTLGDGWLERYDIDAVVHEFNCQWIAGLQTAPLGRHWKEYGAKLVVVMEEYFQAMPTLSR